MASDVGPAGMRAMLSPGTRGSVPSTPTPVPQPPVGAAPTAENPQVTALRKLRQTKNIFALFLFLALVAQIAAFALVEWGGYFELDERNKIGPGKLGPTAPLMEGLDIGLHWAKLVVVFASAGLLLSLIASLLLTLVARRAPAAPPSVGAMTASIWLLVFSLPWSALPVDLSGGADYGTVLAGPVMRFGRPIATSPSSVFLEGQTFTPGSILARRQQQVEFRWWVGEGGADAPDKKTIYMTEAGYFARAVAYPGWLLVVLLLVQLRSRRAFLETVGPAEPTAVPPSGRVG